MTISPEPLELFHRLKSQIKLHSIPYGFMAMRAIEMVEMAFPKQLSENKVKAIQTYHYCFQVNISGSNEVTLILRMPSERSVNFPLESAISWRFVKQLAHSA
jgi:C4-type Zn-finger protein